MTLNGLETTKILQKLICSVFVFMSSYFANFTFFLFVELFLDEHAMVDIVVQNNGDACGCDFKNVKLLFYGVDGNSFISKVSNAQMLSRS